MEITTAPHLQEKEIIERFQILKYKVNEIEIGKIWNRFTEAGFEPILIKGWAASKLYSEPHQRAFTDVDFMIAPEKYQEALEFSAQLNERLPVDLHEGARHLDSVAFEDLFANSIIKKCGGAEIRLLCPEDHLRVLCVHWLTDGGAYREKLWDVYYSIANRPENFDWERLLNITTARRRRWIVCAIGLAYKYLNLDIEDTPIAVEAKNLPAWLVKTIEKEWANEVKLMPLDMFLNDKKMLWRQIKKRFPPNPIQAIVLEEGDFDKNIQLFYQIKNMFRRLAPSIKRVRRRLFFR
jgi:hypothetical protein